VTDRNSPCFVWLAANAGTYGLKNLPSEPWHWSTNGN
jgi:D-alanyl-D-alanine carboxypeptidase